MIKDVKKWMYKEYPLINCNITKIRIASFFGIFVYLFLIIYKPYEVKNMAGNFYIFSIGYSLCTFIGLVLGFIGLPKIAKKYFKPCIWKIKNEILFLTINFLIVSLLIYLYKEAFGAKITYTRDFLEVLLICLSIGVFPIMILVFSVEIKMKRINKKAALEVNKLRVDKENIVHDNEKEIVINTETRKNSQLTFPEEDFIFAQGMGNYSSIYFMNNQKVNRTTIRINLKNLFEQISFDNHHIIRCHRSYIINKNKILTIKGNARSLIMILEGVKEEIPISRSFDKSLLT